MENRIERMRGKLSASKEMMSRRLKFAKGDELTSLLGRMDLIDQTLTWQPFSSSPGNGVVGEATRRMSRGQRP